MTRLCPSLLGLRVFETTARHLNMSRAAQELCITQGAVSRQILNLEKSLGILLFERVKQRLILTDQGKVYLSSIQPLLAGLERVTLEIRSSGKKIDGRLQIACVPTFAAKWLIPRLPQFLRKYPNASVNFVSYAQFADFSTNENVDVAIRFGEGVWRQTKTDYLTGRSLSAVTSTETWDQIQSITNLRADHLLHHTSLPHAWSDWLTIAGIDSIDAYSGPRFEQFSLLIQAAVSGMGVALVPRCLIESELEEHKIQILSDKTIDSWKGYYLCCADEKAQKATIQAFRSWILESISHSEH